MASVYRDRRSPNWSVNFRYGGKQFLRSLDTKDRGEATALKVAIERTIADMKRGRLVLPAGADVWSFIRSDGKLTGPVVAPPKALTLADLFDRYFATQIGQKEKNTLETEGLHRKHLERVIGGRRAVESLTGRDVQEYIAGRTGSVKPQTIKKEVATLRMLLNRAGKLTGTKVADVREMFRGLDFPKGAEKPAFMSWGEVTALVKKRKPDAAAAKELWDRLFLSVDEVHRFVEWAIAKPTRQPVPYFAFMLAAAAYTGARLSELRRSKVEDWDFESKTVVINEKKKSQKGETRRRVGLSDRLAAIMRTWFDEHHPGGTLVFCRLPDVPLVSRRLGDTFHEFTAKSDWRVVRGFHTLRHSFATNLARAGVAESIIDEMMGHQTVEMRKRYRHFFPEQRQSPIDRVFGSGGSPSASSRARTA